MLSAAASLLFRHFHPPFHQSNPFPLRVVSFPHAVLCAVLCVLPALLAPLPAVVARRDFLGAFPSARRVLIPIENVLCRLERFLLHVLLF